MNFQTFFYALRGFAIIFIINLILILFDIASASYHVVRTGISNFEILGTFQTYTLTQCYMRCGELATCDDVSLKIDGTNSDGIKQCILLKKKTAPEKNNCCHQSSKKKPVCVVETKTGYEGTRLAKLENIGTVEQCVGECQQNVKCEFWIYFEKSKVCELKDCTAKKAPLYHAVSGNRVCVDVINGDYCKIERHTDNPGYDIRLLNVETMKECTDECYKEETCKYWLYYQAENICHLKSDTDSKVDNVRYTSGNKACWNDG